MAEVLMVARRARHLMHLGVVIAAVVSALGCSDHEPAPAAQPNIILIIADTLRRDYLGAYGFEGDVSPRLDRFSAGAVLFENAISAAPWTKPSVASIFTSLRPEAHRLTKIAMRGANRFQTLNPGLPTLAGELRDAGYETAAFYSNVWLIPASGLDRGFDHYEKVTEPAEVVSKRALQFLNARESDRPFFLYLHFMDTHGPYDCPKSEYLKLRSSPSLGADRTLTDEEHSELGYLSDTKTPWLDDQDLRRTLRFWRTCYASSVARFDARLTELLTTLDSEPWRSETAVLFSADHGEALLEHSRSALDQHGWEHGWSLRYHQTRVPLLLRLPAGAHGGTRVQGVVSTLDIMPTLLDLANARQHPSLHGRSLLAYLRGAEGEPRWVASSGVKMRGEMVSIQNRQHKLILGTSKKTLALYDLEDDPGELKDIAKQRPDLVAELKAIAASDLHRLKQADTLPGPTKPVDPAIIEELRALGYVGD